MTLIAVTNPSDESAEAGIVDQRSLVGHPEGILREFGDRLEDGAQVALVENGRVWQYIVTRDDENPESVALRSNNSLAADKRAEGERFIDYVNDTPDAFDYIIEVGYYPLESAAALEEFTVYGINDDGEPFTAVVAATEATVYDAGVQAGLVDEGFENSVKIVAVFKGDQSDLERVPVED